MTILLEVVAPVFGVMALGAFSVKIRVLDEGAVRGLVLYVFNFGIPILLFRSLARTDLPPDMEWGFLLSYYVGAFSVYLGGMALGRFVFKRSLADRAIFGMSAGFSNTVLIGIPILFTAYGPEATLPTLLIIAFHGPVLMSLTTGLIQIGRGSEVSLADQGKTIGLELVRNPIIMGLLIGLLVNLAGLTIPGPLDRVAEMVGATAVPCSLFALGASLAGYPLSGGRTSGSGTFRAKAGGAPGAGVVCGGPCAGAGRNLGARGGDHGGHAQRHQRLSLRSPLRRGSGGGGADGTTLDALLSGNPIRGALPVPQLLGYRSRPFGFPSTRWPSASLLDARSGEPERLTPSRALKPPWGPPWPPVSPASSWPGGRPLGGRLLQSRRLPDPRG